MPRGASLRPTRRPRASRLPIVLLNANSFVLYCSVFFFLNLHLSSMSFRAACVYLPVVIAGILVCIRLDLLLILQVDIQSLMGRQKGKMPVVNTIIYVRLCRHAASCLELELWVCSDVDLDMHYM